MRKAKWYFGIAFSLLVALGGCSSASKSSLETRSANPIKIEKVKGTIPQYRRDKFGDYPDEIYLSAYMRFCEGKFGRSFSEGIFQVVAGTNDVVEAPFNALLSNFGAFHDGDKYSKAFFDIMPGGRGFDRTIFRYDTDRYYD